MNSERNSGKRPMSELKNKKGGVSSSCSKNLPPRYLVNNNDYTCVNETFFTSPRPIEFNSENKVDHESLNRHYTNFEEELEEVEINEEDEETPTPTSPVTEVSPLPTFSNVAIVRVKRSLV